MDFKGVFYQNFMGPYHDLRQVYLQHKELMADPYAHFLTFKDALKQNAKIYILAQELFNKNKFSPDLYFGLSTTDNAGGIGVHNSLFFPTLSLLSNEEQRAKWVPEVLDGRIIGGYAQTEMAHGSDIQSLQTTAVFDPNTSTFVINTPKLSDTKYWPGGMGVFDTHVVLQARTYIHGKYHGIQTFLIQIRDQKTYEPLEGIDVGDIGAKLGFKATDNGYLRLNNVRIPWNQLLMKYFGINAKGEVIVEDPETTRFGYGGMLNLRNHLVRYGVIFYLQATLWAYEATKSHPDQNLVTSKFLQRMAFATSASMLTAKLRELHKKFMSVLAANDLKAAKVLLADLHLMTAGFKSAYMWEGIQISREVFGESAQANLLITQRTSAYSNVIPAATYEGDNSLLQQQLSRSLIRYVEMLMKGKQIKGIGECFNIYEKNVQERIELTPFNLEKDALTLESIQKLLMDIAFKNIVSVAEKFMMMMGETDMNTAWNAKLQYELVQMSRLFLTYQGYQYSLTRFKETKHEASELAQFVTSSLLFLHGLLKVKHCYEIGVFHGIIVKEGKGYERLISEIAKTEDALRPHVKIIRDAIGMEEREVGIFQNFDSNIIEQKAKPTRDLVSDMEKDFAMKFAKMSKL